MRLTSKTLFLLMMVLVLGGLNLLGGDPAATIALPSTPIATPASVTRLSLSTPIQKLTMERLSTEQGTPAFDKWRIVTPLEFPADAAQIRSILRTFGPGVEMEALVDEGNLEDYGVDHQAGVLLELFEANAEVPTTSIVIGKQAAGPSTFVRLAGADTVYRADVGGRARYERPAADWRDKVALDIDTSTARAFTLQRGGETLAFRRAPSAALDKQGNPVPGPWGLAGGAFPIDGDTIDGVARTLGRIRAGEIHNPTYEAGMDAPAAIATFELADGSAHRIVLGGLSDDQASLVRVDDLPDIFRTAAQVGRVMTLPIEAFRDRVIFQLDPDQIASLSLTDGGLTVVLAQSTEGGWAVTQPANMDADQGQAEAMARAVAALRAAAIPADARFEASGRKLTVLLRDGRTHVLEVGQTERDAENRPLLRVRASGREGQFQIMEATFVEIRRAFGRA